MNTELHDLIVRYLDGDISDEEFARLKGTMKENATVRAMFLDHVNLDLALDATAGARAGARALKTILTNEPSRVGEVTVTVPKRQRPLQRTTWRWAGWAAAAALVIGCTLFIVSSNPAAAAVSQIVAAWGHAMDRTYSISVIEGDAWQPLKGDRRVGYEGAKLHLRGRSQFVLVRALDRDGEAITGSDGENNWDIRGKGPVRVSMEANRFRGGIPGEYQNVPFHDMGSLLDSLTADYDITLSHDEVDPSLGRLHAQKRNRETRGLPSMDFLFRKDTGIVIQMELHGLPQERGGPRAVRLTLASESPFLPDFFTHEAHHEPGRQVIVETANPKP